jgi:hypothetical protein
MINNEQKTISLISMIMFFIVRCINTISLQTKLQTSTLHFINGRIRMLFDRLQLCNFIMNGISVFVSIMFRINGSLLDDTATIWNISTILMLLSMFVIQSFEFILMDVF